MVRKALSGAVGRVIHGRFGLGAAVKLLRGADDRSGSRTGPRRDAHVSASSPSTGRSGSRACCGAASPPAGSTSAAATGRWWCSPTTGDGRDVGPSVECAAAAPDRLVPLGRARAGAAGAASEPWCSRRSMGSSPSALDERRAAGLVRGPAPPPARAGAGRRPCRPTWWRAIVRCATSRACARARPPSSSSPTASVRRRPRATARV